MKEVIVIFVGCYLPGKKYGGVVVSIKNFVDNLYKYYDIKIICNDHEADTKERYKGIFGGWNRVGNAEVYYIKERNYNLKYFNLILDSIKGKIKFVYLSGIYYFKMNFCAISIAKNRNIPVLLAPRGDILEGKICSKGKIKKLLFLKVVRIMKIYRRTYFQATSIEEKKSLIKFLDIYSEKIFLVSNLPGKNLSKVSQAKKKNELKVVFVSRLARDKNLKYAIQVMQNIPDKCKVQFDIYGPCEHKKYWNECKREIQKCNSNISICYKGLLDYEIAKTIYTKYHCFLFPTLGENYGHVIEEAMLADCPVILSKGTTPWDDYGQKGGYVIELADKEKFVNAVIEIAQMNQKEYESLIEKNRNYINEKIDLEELVVNYLDMIEKVSSSL